VTNRRHSVDVAYSSPKEKGISGTKHVASFLPVHPQENLMYSPGLSPGETAHYVAGNNSE
jgi:hypothetical protein